MIIDDIHTFQESNIYLLIFCSSLFIAQQSASLAVFHSRVSAKAYPASGQNAVSMRVNRKREGHAHSAPLAPCDSCTIRFSPDLGTFLDNIIYCSAVNVISIISEFQGKDYKFHVKYGYPRDFFSW